MPSSIQHLDSTTSKSIQASLLFPTLTSVVLELVNRSLNAKPSSIEVWITLAPEWQITCQYDAAAQKFAPDNQYTDSGLDYLSYLGVVDVQHGQYRHILKAGSTVFSGCVDAAVGSHIASTSSVTLRDFFRNLPVRRHALQNATVARSELEKCRRTISIAILPYYSTRVTLTYNSVGEVGSKIILDVPKATSLLARYEKLFSLCVNVPGSALSISRIEQIKQSQLQVKGFLVPSLLPSRSHQHILINGRLQDDADYTSHHGADLRTTILQILEASYIGSNRRNTQNCDAKDYASSGRYFGYFVDIQIGKPEQLDQKDLEMVIRNIISEVLQANNLLISVGKDQTQTGRRNDLKEQSPTKKLRTFSGLSVENNAFVHRNNVRQYKLDRAGLLREPKASDDQASWVREALSSWKSTLPEELPEEQRISSLCKDDQYGEQEGHLKLDRGHTLQRTGLASSRVVGQVDAKYISIVYGDDTLVLVDQHAAHERVRLEAMLSQYVRDCLDKHSSRTPRHTSKLISLPVHLARAFKDEETIQSLAFWGFDILLGEEQRTDALIQIDAIPCIMNEKLGSDQALGAFLVDLAASLEDESVRRRMKLSPLSLAQAQSENGWIITLGHLPTPILDLFNSMACRGAIMFNDPLTHSQCERLIKQLSDTTFCFICAHGRPVTAPIASLQLPHTRSSPIRWSALRE